MGTAALRLLEIDRQAQGWDRQAVDLGPVLSATLDLYQRRGYQPPWIGYVALEGQQIVGTCGFAAPPQGGEAEIAYYTFPSHEGRGVATRMAQALIERVRPHAGGIRLIAHTLPAEGASTTILRKLGFEFLGAIEHPEDGIVWKWAERSPSAALGPARRGSP